MKHTVTKAERIKSLSEKRPYQNLPALDVAREAVARKAVAREAVASVFLGTCLSDSSSLSWLVMKLQRWEGFSDLPLGGRFLFSSSILLSVQEPIPRGFCRWTSLERLQGGFLSFSDLPLGGRVSFSSSLLLSVQEPIPRRYCRWTSLERLQVFTKEGSTAPPCFAMIRRLAVLNTHTLTPSEWLAI